MHAGTDNSSRDARSRRGPGGCHAASRPSGGSVAGASGAARHARPSAGEAAGPKRRQAELRAGFIPLSRRARRVFQLQSRGRARPARRPAGRVGRRKIDAVCADAALLSRAGRPHPGRRAGHRAHHPGQPAGSDCVRAAGCLAVPSHRDGKHPLRAAGRDRRHGSGRRARRTMRFHRKPAERVRHRRRLPRHQAVGRPAAADRDRAGVSPGRAVAAARRGDLVARQRIRGSDPRVSRPADAGPHGDCDCAPAFHRSRFRSHRAAAGRHG